MADLQSLHDYFQMLPAFLKQVKANIQKQGAAAYEKRAWYFSFW